MNRDTDRLDPGFDPRIADWLETDPDTAPRETLDTVLAALPSIPQRRAIRAPWRFPYMFTPARAAVAAVLGVALVGGALLLLQRSQQPSVGVQPSPSPSASLSTSAPPLGLALVDLNGHLRRDLGVPHDAWMADLSADGTRLAFVTASDYVGFCGACGAPRRIAVVPVGSTRGAYLNHGDGPRVDASTMQQPAWSPDGSRIAIQGVGPDGNIDLYVIDLVDSDPFIGGPIRRLTTDPAIDEFPAWSPDGKTIVYVNGGSVPLDDSGLSTTQEIWSVPVDGGAPVRLTDNDAPDSQPDVAINGTVVFRRDNEIYTMALDGADQERLDTAPSGFGPRWSPDGTRLAMLRYDPSERAQLPSELGHGTDLPLLEVLVVDVATGEVTFVGPRVATDLNPVSWTTDGEALLINRYDHRP